MTTDEIKMCTRIQRFYDLLQSRLEIERECNAIQNAVENELFMLVDQFQTIFCHIVYDENSSVKE